jgi:anaerobic C4-dicarboxylate transporter
MIPFATIGLAVVATLGLISVFGLMIVDSILGSQNQETVAERLQAWTKHNPWFSAVLTFTLGVLIAHFFWPG